jgi:hypothetical protein
MGELQSRVVISIFLLTAISLGQRPAQPVVRLENLMSASEFRSAGLNKLNSDELSVLNLWLSDYATRIYTAATAVHQDQTTDAAIESQIEGDFNGWDGETIFKLTNGQIWQQASYAYTYHYAYRPQVIIYKSGGISRMKVEDVDSTIAVKRLK